MNRAATLTIVATGTAALMIGMDFIGVAAVLTQVEEDLGTDLTDAQWMLNVYALTFGMGIVVGGKLGDTYGTSACSWPALFALLFSLNIGADSGWSSPAVIALLAGSVASFVAFAILEPRSHDPLIPPRLLRDRGFVAALVANGLIAVVWFSAFIYIPEYGQKVLGYSPLGAAAMLLPGMFVFAVLSPLSGRFYERLGARTLIAVGMAAMTLTGVNLTIVQDSWGFWGLLPGVLLLGTGAGLAISSAGTAAVAAVDEAHAGSAGGLSFMFHLVVGATGVAIVTAIFESQADGAATGAEFVDGLHTAYLFGIAVAAVGILNALFIHTTDQRMRSGSA